MFLRIVVFICMHWGFTAKLTTRSCRTGQSQYSYDCLSICASYMYRMKLPEANIDRWSRTRDRKPRIKGKQ